MTNNETQPQAGFYGLGIAPKLLEALDKLNFKVPTPIQQKAIQPAIAGSDLVGIAQTGTGKTIAFALPMIQRLAAMEGAQGLVLLPTRELAYQVADVMKQFAPLLHMKVAVVIGGESMNRQVSDLRSKPRIILATPGRLIDHLQQRTVSLSAVRMLVLDEADRMLDMGFAPQIEKILAGVPKERQTMLFSATMPDEIMKLASVHMKLPLRIEVARPGTAAEKVRQELYIVEKADKIKLLGKLLDKHWGSVLLFMRTKHNAKKLTRQIKEMPHSAAEIHSNRSVNQRKEALDGFKSGKYRVLVATDIAARGIDVTGIELVVNYDLPDDADNYVHRIGRTGRAGQPGLAISFATPDQGADVRDIERTIRMPLPVAKHPDVQEKEFSGAPSPKPQQNRRQGGRQQGGGQPRQQPQRQEQRGPDGQRRPQDSQRHGGRDQRRGGGHPGGRDQRGQRNDHGRGGRRNSGRESIVTDSPYFEGEAPRRDYNRPHRQERPAQQPAAKPEGGWLSRFIKKTTGN